MSEFTPLIGKKLKYLVPEYRTDSKGAVEFRQGERTGTVKLEVPDRREVQIEGEFFRFEDVTVLEVEGRPLAEFMAGPPPPPPPPVTRWSPIAKIVLNFETGVMHAAATALVREELKLPPWTPALAAAQAAAPPLLITPELAARVQAEIAAETTGVRAPEPPKS
jgi:hypothetical protein